MRPQFVIQESFTASGNCEYRHRSLDHIPPNRRLSNGLHHTFEVSPGETRIEQIPHNRGHQNASIFVATKLALQNLTSAGKAPRQQVQHPGTAGRQLEPSSLQHLQGKGPVRLHRDSDHRSEMVGQNPEHVPPETA